MELVSPAEVGLLLEVDEVGETFADNARLKAEAFTAASGLPVLADDSGLEVDALGGEPGVRSARYGGPGLTEEARYRLVLARLIDVPWERRGARFRCVVALAVDQAGSLLRNPAADSTGRVWLAEGRCEGFVACAPRGAHGFGYDPVFFVPEYGLTMAELASEAKNRISHRARAVQAIRAILARQLRIGRPAEIGPAAELPPVLSEVRIRPLRPDDFPSLMQRCGLAQDELALALAAVDVGTSPALVAELDGQAIALGGLRLHGRTAEISRLVVSPSAPVQGIEQALLHVLAEVARDRGAEPA